MDMNPETLGWLLAGAGWLIIIGLSVACFRSSRDDGDHTPQGRGARGIMFVAGCGFGLLAILPVMQFAEHWFKQ